MKNMKNKLIASAVMLAISAVMLTSASFAWFTVSTAPTIDSIEVTMTATNNLEIAKAKDNATEPLEVTANDAGDETKWGGKVTSFTGAEITFPATMDGSTFKTVGYTTDGRTNNLETITISAAPTLDANGKGAITHSVTNGPSGAKVAAVYGVWLRSNEAKTVTVTVGGTPSISGGGALASGKTATDAVKTFVLVDGAVAESVSLTANTPQLVQIAVYVDGDAVIASSVASQMTISGLNVTFS